MKIKKILWQTNVEIEGKNYDVCMKNIGIENFDDSDEERDEDFNKILKLLVENENYRIKLYNPKTKESEIIENARISDIRGYLAYYDHVNFIVETGEKEIVFTLGHEIFWLNGFSKDIINSLGFQLEEIQNDRIKEIF